MNPKEYVKNVLITEAQDKTPMQTRMGELRNARLIHSVLGLASEIGEIRELALKKFGEGDPEIDTVNLKEEMGDLFWYMGISVDTLGLEPNQVFTDSSQDLTHYGWKIERLNLEIDQMSINIGNAVDLIKKTAIYGKELDVQKYASVLFAISVNIETCLNMYGMTGDQARERNIEKLRARYGEKFTEAAALNRDLEKERKVLEAK